MKIMRMSVLLPACHYIANRTSRSIHSPLDDTIDDDDDDFESPCFVTSFFC